MLFDFASALIFMLAAAAFIGITLIISRLVQPRNPTPGKEATYECGELPVGSGWIQFNIRFYVIALIFIIFDVEIVFLFPWGVIFKDFLLKDVGKFAFVEMAIFIAVLLVGLAYVWRKGDLEWDKPQTGKYSREAAPAYFEEVKEEVVA